MKKIFALAAVLALAGCATHPESARSDFTYEDIPDYGKVAVRASSAQAGIAIEISASCIDGDARYSITPTSFGPYMAAEKRWTLNIDGTAFWKGSASYDDETTFKASLATLEVVGPQSAFGGGGRYKVANERIDQIPDRCNKLRADHLADVRATAEKDRQKDDLLISDVVSRTGSRPMLPGKNSTTFNEIIVLLQESGVSKHKGKFVWVTDGDYRIAKVSPGSVLLISITSPDQFPAITIITDKEAMEGQFWSSVSSGPLELVGTSTYPTIFGARQTIVFKSI